ncbi:MAG: hypothetical protein H6567_10710 [Lewinellaceae bacterium]|nr:hypothetical protein [Lewinellaceae bacterium]
MYKYTVFYENHFGMCIYTFLDFKQTLDRFDVHHPPHFKYSELFTAYAATLKNFIFINY